MAANKAVATTKAGGALATSEGFEEFAGSGMENVTSSDILIPRLTILQALSPQISQKKAEFIPGAEVGMICDVGTEEVFPHGLIFLPVYFEKQWLEWGPRASNIGLAGIHKTDLILQECTYNERRQPILPNGNYIAETSQMFGINVTANMRLSFIPFSSTQLKKCRRWLTLSTGEELARRDGSKFTPPLFYRSYNLSTVDESNAEGDWSGWKIERAMSLPELGESMGFDFKEVMGKAIMFHKSLMAGSATADVASMRPESGETAAGDEGAM